MTVRNEGGRRKEEKYFESLIEAEMRKRKGKKKDRKESINRREKCIMDNNNKNENKRDT